YISMSGYGAIYCAVKRGFQFDGYDEYEGREVAAVARGDVAAIVRVERGMLAPVIVLTDPID
ncbi:MAG: hypothetical protein ACH36H_11245, partial [Candidatus Nanopelagicales bacterium]